MALKKRFPAIENVILVVGKADIEEVFPQEFLIEVEEFIRRNSLLKIRGKCGLDVDHCCEKCLKAYAIKRAKELGLGKREMGMLEKIDVDCGHDGYYLDREKLLRI